MCICALPFLAGCPQKKSVITSINKDGSCVRKIGFFDPRKFEGIDSVIHHLPVPVDQSWNLEVINDSTALLVKRFESVKAMNASYAADESTLSASHRKAELVKEFKWFYTAFKYSETYGGVLTDIPLSEYLQPVEIEALKSDDPEKYLEKFISDRKSRKSLSDNIEERMGFWLHDHIYVMAFDDIIHIADSMQLLDVQLVNVAEVKDTVRQQIEDSKKQIISLDFDDSMDFVELAGMIGVNLQLDTSAIEKLKHHVAYADLEEKFEKRILFGISEDYHHMVIMPGLLIDTNAEVVGGDTLKWDLAFIKYLDSDFVMYAESRITNVWAYIVSVLIVLLAAIIPFLGKIKNKTL
jgi:hypothetical protein